MRRRHLRELKRIGDCARERLIPPSQAVIDAAIEVANFVFERDHRKHPEERAAILESQYELFVFIAKHAQTHQFSEKSYLRDRVAFEAVFQSYFHEHARRFGLTPKRVVADRFRNERCSRPGVSPGSGARTACVSRPRSARRRCGGPQSSIAHVGWLFAKQLVIRQ